MTAISLISLMSQISLGYHILETEQVKHIVTIGDIAYDASRVFGGK